MVIHRHDRLSIVVAKDHLLLDPIISKSGLHALKAGAILVEQCLRLEAVDRLVAIDVVRNVDHAAVAITLRRNEVRVLDQAAERDLASLMFIQ